MEATLLLPTLPATEPIIVAKPATRPRKVKPIAAPPSELLEPKAVSIADWASELVTELASQLSTSEIVELRSQVTALGETAASDTAPSSNPTKPTIVRDQDALAQLAERVAKADELVIDLETSGLDPRQGEIVGIGLALSDATFYIPVNHRFETGGALRPGQLPLIEVLDALRLEEKSLIGHNAKFETKWLRHHGGIRCCFVWDTMLAGRLLRSDLSAELKELAVRELDVPAWDLAKAEIERIQLLPIETVAASLGSTARS